MSEPITMNESTVKPLPVALTKVLEVQERADSGLADSREFTPDKIVKFSPLVRTKVLKDGDRGENSTEEINLSTMSESDQPMQSSGVTDQRMNAPDISAIKGNLKDFSF